MAGSRALIRASWRAFRSDTSLWQLTLYRSVANAMFTAVVVVRFNPKGAFTNDVPLLRSFVGAEGARFDNLRFDLFSLGWLISLLIGFLFVLPTSVVDSTIVAKVIARLRGQLQSNVDAFEVARLRLPVIVQYGLINLAFGALTRILDDLLGSPINLLVSILSWVWIAITALALQVIVVERLGAIASLRRSTALFRKNWGALIAGFLLVWTTFALMTLLATLPVLLVVVLTSASPVVFFVVMGIAAFVLFEIAWTVNDLFDTTVYAHATGGGKKSVSAAMLLAGAYGSETNRRGANRTDQDPGPLPSNKDVSNAASTRRSTKRRTAAKRQRR